MTVNDLKVESEPDRLDRSMGLGQITASGVGIIIGAGIYVLLGAATQEAGAAVWLAFLVAGVLSALTALSYAELVAMFPNAGAEYDYTRRVAPEWIAFSVGWLMILGLVVAAAAVSLGFASYLRYFVDIPHQVGAWGLLLLAGGIAAAGIQQSARITVVLSTIQVGGLIGIVVLSVPYIGDVNLVADVSTAGVVSAAALVFFAFVGFDEVITLAEETRDASWTVPRALLLALGVSTALYIAVAIAGVSVLGASALAASEQPLADVIARASGITGANVVAVVALLATTNTTLLAITAASRLQFGMARQGALPPVLGRINRRKVPLASVASVLAVSAGFVLFNDLSLVASVTDFAVYAVFIAVNVTVILLRMQQPDRLRPFRIHGSIGRIPITPVLALLTVGLLLPSLEPKALALGAAVVCVGLVLHVALQRYSRLGDADSSGAPENPGE